MKHLSKFSLNLIIFGIIFGLYIGINIVDTSESLAESKITSTPSGLRYEVLTSGKGEKALSGKTVEVHYTGWLNKDDSIGKKFDSSVDRGTPFRFPLGAGRVIKGWDEGVAGMNVGEKRRLYIPSDLAYGSRGAGAVIPPNANLIFDVELLKVQ